MDNMKVWLHRPSNCMKLAVLMTLVAVAYIFFLNWLLTILPDRLGEVAVAAFCFGVFWIAMPVPTLVVTAFVLKVRELFFVNRIAANMDRKIIELTNEEYRKND